MELLEKGSGVGGPDLMSTSSSLSPPLGHPPSVISPPNLLCVSLVREDEGISLLDTCPCLPYGLGPGSVLEISSEVECSVISRPLASLLKPDKSTKSNILNNCVSPVVVHMTSLDRALGGEGIRSAEHSSISF